MPPKEARPEKEQQIYELVKEFRQQRRNPRRKVYLLHLVKQEENHGRESEDSNIVAVLMEMRPTKETFLLQSRGQGVCRRENHKEKHESIA